MCEFPFNFFIFYTLFCSLSQNKPGRQDVPFVALGHIYIGLWIKFLALIISQRYLGRKSQVFGNPHCCDGSFGEELKIEPWWSILHSFRAVSFCNVYQVMQQPCSSSIRVGVPLRSSCVATLGGTSQLLGSSEYSQNSNLAVQINYSLPFIGIHGSKLHLIPIFESDRATQGHLGVVDEAAIFGRVCYRHGRWLGRLTLYKTKNTLLDTQIISQEKHPRAIQCQLEKLVLGYNTFSIFF